MSKSLFPILKSPVKFNWFLITQLPMAYLAGVKLEEVSEEKAVVSIRYKYLTKNPFRSIYFACLSMAGEFASGVLSLTCIYGVKPPVSMLVTHMEADFTKKAIGKIRFVCNDGKQIAQAIDEARKTGESRTLVATSSGFDESGDKVAEFRITWSYKAKLKQ
ncbi:MAG TPA: DUF4442 domain-containing protein [Cytophagaceae bacterium]